MDHPPQPEVRAVVDELRRQLAEMTARLAQLESTLPPVAPGGDAGIVPLITLSRPAAETAGTASSDHMVAPAAPGEELSEEILIAISAAVAAFLGERVHVRQIRLISSSAWAQQGRVSIQGSHRLDR